MKFTTHLAKQLDKAITGFYPWKNDVNKVWTSYHYGTDDSPHLWNWYENDDACGWRVYIRIEQTPNSNNVKISCYGEFWNSSKHTNADLLFGGYIHNDNTKMIAVEIHDWIENKVKELINNKTK